MIVNPSAGRGRARKVLPQIEDELRRHGVQYRVSETTSLAHARELASEAAASGWIAAALGGDGLVGAVAAQTSECDGVMAMLPGGRGNDLARVLGIPVSPGGCVDVLVHGRESSIDLGIANGRTFCCIASCGFDSDANRIANEASVPGSVVYLYAAIKALIQWRPARFSITLDGSRRDLTGFSVIVANSKAYGSGMFVAPNAELDDGMLDVVTIADSSKTRFLANLPRVFKGTHLEAPTVDAQRAREVRIEADRPFTVYADGDPICELPADITVKPQAVRVMLP